MESCCNYLRRLCFPKQGPSEGTIYLHSGYLLLSFGPQSVSKLVNLLLCTSSGRQREGQAPMSRNSFEGCNEGRDGLYSCACVLGEDRAGNGI